MSKTPAPALHVWWYVKRGVESQGVQVIGWRTDAAGRLNVADSFLVLADVRRIHRQRELILVRILVGGVESQVGVAVGIGNVVSGCSLASSPKVPIEK